MMQLAMMEVAIKGKDPLMLAREFLELFHRRLVAGAISRERALRML